MTDIENMMGIKIPLATILKSSTIKDLAQVVRKQDWSSDWDILVPIQPLGTKPPLFFIHASEGNVLFYRELAQYLGNDQPFFGFQDQDLSGKLVVGRRIENMAAHYIKKIQTIQPHGPYYIGGFCLGGAIAFEMSQQLQKEDEEVSLLVMIQNLHRDYPRYKSNTNMLQRHVDPILDRFDYEVSNLRNLVIKEKLIHIYERFQRALLIINFNTIRILDRYLQRFDLRIPHPSSYFLEFITERNKEAFIGYNPQAYNGRVAIFRASKQPREIIPDPTLGWGELIDGDLELFEIEAFHQTIMAEPQVQIMAEQLKICLNKAYDASSGS